MLIQTTYLPITIPVKILVVTRKDIRFLIKRIGPDVFPAFKSSSRLITELHSLITVCKVVMTPTVIRITIRALSIGFKVLFPGNRNNTIKRIMELTCLIPVREFQFKTNIPVAIQILHRSRSTDNSRKQRAFLAKHSCTRQVCR